MKKISEMKIGATIKDPLLLKECAVKMTKNNKPYLWAVFTDGVDTLTGQDWDWQTNPALMPDTKLEAGNVYEIVGSISEYNGNKQVKLIRIAGTDIEPHVFAPSGGIDRDEWLDKYDELLSSIETPKLHSLVDNVINDVLKDFQKLPAAKGMHHAYVHGLLQHTVSVAQKAKAIAELTPMCNVDMVVAGALLHDIGKVRTYVLNGALIDMSLEGQLVEHIMLGAMMVDKYRTPENTDVVDLLLHIISSHHGVLEYGSPTTPRCIEAVIVNFADGVDAKTQMIIEEVKKTTEDATWTNKIWAMNNHQMMTPWFIESKLK